MKTETVYVIDRLQFYVIHPRIFISLPVMPLKSWVEYDGANTQYPLENLPFGVFSSAANVCACYVPGFDSRCLVSAV